MSAPLRTVIVGFGAVADTLAEDPRMAEHFRWSTHAQVLAEHPAFEWGAVVDPSAEALARARDKWGIAHLAPDLRALAGRYDPEVAVIATPPEHRIGSVESLTGLRAVLLEKPLGASLASAEALVAACERRGIPVQVNYWRRGVDGFRALAGGDLEARIGGTQAAFGVYGNGLRNNGSHLVDFVRMLLGEIRYVQATGPATPRAAGPLPGDVQVPFTLGLTSGGVAMLAPVDFEHYREVSLDVWGQRGRLCVQQEGLSTLAYPLVANRGLDGEREVASDRPAPLEIPVARAFWCLYENLARALGEGVDLLSPGSSALATERVVEAVLESVRAGGRRIALAGADPGGAQ